MIEASLDTIYIYKTLEKENLLIWKRVFWFLKNVINRNLNERFVAFCSFFPCSLTVVLMGRQQKSGSRQYRNISQKCNKTSCCIVAWSRQTFWFKLNFLLPRNESVLNILVHFLGQFQRFSRDLQPLEKICKIVLEYTLS